jgi:hypothetical protein
MGPTTTATKSKQYANPDKNSFCNTNSDANTNSYMLTNTYCYIYTDFDPNTFPNSYSVIIFNPNKYSNTKYSNPNTKHYPNYYRNTNRYPNYQRNADQYSNNK